MIGNDDRTNAREFSIGPGALTEAGTRSSSRFYQKLVRGDYIVNAAALRGSGSNKTAALHERLRLD